MCVGVRGHGGEAAPAPGAWTGAVGIAAGVHELLDANTRLLMQRWRFGACLPISSQAAFRTPERHTSK